MCSFRLKGEDGFFIPGGARYVSIVVPTYFVENYKRNALSSTLVLHHYEIPHGVEHRRNDRFSLEKVRQNGIVSDVHPFVQCSTYVEANDLQT
jgi:hypothetical protein